MMKIVFLLLLLMVVTIGPVKSRAAEEKPCLCHYDINEVCGSDGVTYSNLCVARCRGVSVAHQGICQLKAVQLPADTSPHKGCACPEIYRPVCGADGKTYGNTCEAECSGVSIVHQGECRLKAVQLPADTSPNDRCACPYINHPVCGSDGKTYGNTCEAECSKVTVVNEGPCQVKRRLATSSVCFCNYSLMTVCGNNGVTYDNPDCAKRCGGVTDYVIGACDDVCACTKEYDPVCHSITGTKYANRCLARCLRADSTQLESCDEVNA